MSLLHCFECNLSFVRPELVNEHSSMSLSPATIHRNNMLKCIYCEGGFIEIIEDTSIEAHDDARNVLSILKQEFDNIMKAWTVISHQIHQEYRQYSIEETSEDSARIPQGIDECPAGTEPSINIYIRSERTNNELWNRVFRYLLQDKGETIDTILSVIEDTKDPATATENNSSLVSLRKHRGIFIMALVNILYHEMEIKREPLPASKKYVLGGMRTFKLKADDLRNLNEDNCPICHEKYEYGKTCKELPCNHIFHSTCIRRWLSTHNTCPLCKYKVPTDDQNYEIYHRLLQDLGKQLKIDIASMVGD